ncbi:MAG: lamin tail domain-containing protein, partial [Planctomycetota bacterium]|nr:lamin tail domain-containing protein [Planctomycetota bacterium]
DMHAGKNYFYYHDPVTDKWSVINWDIDLCWTTTYNGGGGLGPLYDDNPYVHLLDLPELRVAYNNRVREIVDLLFNFEQTGMLLDEIAGFVYTPGQPSFVDADCAMWDYNPILVSDYVNLGKADHGRFYENSATDDFAGMVQLLKNYVQNKVDGFLAGQDYAFDPKVASDEGLQPGTPTVTYTGAAGYPADQLAFHCSNFSGSGAAFDAMEWRIAEVSVPGTPQFDPDEPRHYEIDADWESGELATFDPDVALPTDVVQEGKRYRVRVRMKDANGRYSHWSDPVEFVAGAPVGSSLPLRITEIMYNPPERNPMPGHPEAPYGDNDYFEYVELQNISTSTISLNTVRFTEGVHFTFPAVTLDAGDHVLVVRNQDAFEARYGTGLNVAGEFEDDTVLSNSEDDLRLEDSAGLAIHEFDYKDGWYGLTDGDGYSLVIRDAQQDLDLWDDADGWRTSWQFGGSPGAPDTGPDLHDVVINELLAHSDGPDGDWIELMNTSGAAVDVDGWYLSDSDADLAALTKFQISSAICDTVLEGTGAGRFLVLTQTDDFGEGVADPWFALSEFGEAVYLTARVEQDDIFLAGSPASWPDGWYLSGCREDADFGATPAEQTLGRYVKSTGGADFVLMSAATRGDENAYPDVPDIIINEIMYHPQDEETGQEWIELANRTGADIALWEHLVPGGGYPEMDVGWAFTDGILFTFPIGACVPADGYALVVQTDPAAFRTEHGIPESVNIYGPYDLNLANDGERVALSRPGEPEIANPPPGQTAPYVPYIEIEKITYEDSPPWPIRADGDGSALARIDPDAYIDDVLNWPPSTTGGTPG